MSKFITGKDLEDTVYDIIWEAKETLLIVSPFVKLDDYFKELFDKHKNEPNLHLIVVFGKNENAVRKSLSKDDFDYFKKFLNISIIYVPNLHAKYFGNEQKGVITSINLYDYSFKNNIEYGVYSEINILSKFSKSADIDAWNTSLDIANKNEAVFIKRPVYQHKKIIINLGKQYVKSEVIFDSTDKFYSRHSRGSKEVKYLTDFPDEIELGSNSSVRPQREDVKEEREPKHGYCIRTRKRIPFNPKQPLSKAAWETWIDYEDRDYHENFCHKTGKKSYGKTSMRIPIL